MAIVISPSLVLSESEQFSLSFPIIGWDNQITSQGTSADFEDDNFPASNIANTTTNLYWKSTSTDEQYVYFDLSENREANYIGIARHNFGSGGVVVSIETQSSDDESWIEIFEGFVVGSDAPIIVRFQETTASSLRLRLLPSSTIPEIAVVYIGQLLVIPIDIPAGHTPLIDGRITRVTDGVAESGDYLGSIVLSQKLASSVTFQFLEDDWYTANMRPFVRLGRGATFFFSGFPNSHPEEASYAWLTNDPRPVFAENFWVDITLEMSGVIS